MTELPAAKQTPEEVGELVTLHLDEALTHCRRLAELLHNRPTRNALDLKAARFLVYIGWLLERDSADRKLNIELTAHLAEKLRQAWEEQP
jgi:hypothetical protein